MGPSTGNTFTVAQTYTVSNYTGGHSPYIIIETHDNDGKRNFEYALIRNQDTGEARGVFHVPETERFSVKMAPKERWLRWLGWKRFDWLCLTNKELEEISEGQYETYLEFGLKEFKVRTEPSLGQAKSIAVGFMSGAIGSVTVSLGIAFDWFVSIPELIFVTTSIIAIGYSVGVIVVYRARTQK